MAKHLRAALVVVAIACLAIAVYDPVMRFVQNRSMESEMEELRALKRSGQAAQATPSASSPPSAVSSGDAPDPTVNPPKSQAMQADEPSVGVGEAENALPDGTEQNGLGSVVSNGITPDPERTTKSGETESGVGSNDVQTEVATTTSAPDSSVSSDSAENGSRQSALYNEDTHTTPDPQVSAANEPYKASASAPTPTPKPPFVFDDRKILPEYRPLYEKNHDLVGWITIDGTVIDYPVVRRDGDAEYYLHRDFFGNDNINGQIMLSEHCDPFSPSVNVVLSGHRMNNGSMFGDLNKYASEAYGRSHSIIAFDTLFERVRYKLVAAFYTANDGEDVSGLQFNVDIRYRRQMIDYLKLVKDARLYDTGVDACDTDELLTLSTCSYHVHNGRFVVIARRMRAGEVE